MELELITLPNGVRIALDPMANLETAAIGVWQRVGARWEAAHENGVAHLFEHMAFKGAGGRDARQFAEAVEDIGAVMNAATSYERTSYFARVTREHAAAALHLVADTLLDPHWAAEDFEKEKGVVAQERGEARDQPDDHVFELHQAALYPDQPLGRPILGLEETLAPMGVEALAAFRAAHMAPERVLIAAVGAYDREAMLACAQKRFGALTARPALPLEPARAAPGCAREARRLEQTHLVLSWPAPAAGDDALYAARLMCEIYGGGMSSRLFQEVREARGLVYAIDAFIDALEDCGRLGVYAGCAARHAKTVALIAGDLLAALARDGPTERELARAKTIAAASILMGAESPMGRAEARVSQVFLRGRLIAFDEIQRKLNAVTIDDVRHAAALAIKGPACVAVIGPRSGLAAADAFHARFAKEG